MLEFACARRFAVVYRLRSCVVTSRPHVVSCSLSWFVCVCVALVQAVAEFPLFTAVYKISYEGAPVKSIVENLTHL